MRGIRRGLLPVLFGLACAVFNWPLVSLFLEKSPYSAFLGIFAAMGVLTAAIGLFAAVDPGEPSNAPQKATDRVKPNQPAEGG